MKRFEHTRYFQLLEPFVNPLLQRLFFRDERYILFFTQILLSGLLYILSSVLQPLLLGFVNQANLLHDVAEVLTSFIHLGTVLIMFWCIWYALTLTFRMANTMRFGSSWLSPRLLSCILTGSMTLSIGLREGEALGHAFWFYAMLGLSWAYACLRPTLFGADS